MIGAILVGLLVWCIISFWFFINTMGYKYRKTKWYDYPLLAPVFVIATVAGWISTLFGCNK